MHKVYLLLRNNKQNGPYSLEELLQLGLKPYDLIWVEGKSAGWRYPSEIDALKPYVPESVSSAMSPKSTNTEVHLTSQPGIPSPGNTPGIKSASGKHIYVSMPGRGQSQPPMENTPYTGMEPGKPKDENHAYPSPREQKQAETSSPLPHSNYSRTLQEMEEEYTNWVYQNKTRRKNHLVQKQILAVLVIGIVITGFYFGATRIMATRTGAEPQAELARPLRDPSTVSVAEKKPPVSDVNNDNLPASNLNANSVAINKDATPTNGTTKTSLHGTTENINVKSNSHIIKKPKDTEKQKQPAFPLAKAENPAVTQDKPLMASKPAADPAESKKETEKTTTPEQNERKRKGLFSGLFSKFKHKKDEQISDQSSTLPNAPATTIQGNERKSVRRGDDPKPQNSSPQPTADPSILADKVDITSNERSEDWMMGINGLKITVHNRNNVGIKKASVEVLYYDENNHLLDKKTVYFSNIPPKGNSTVQAPEQRFADHVDYKLTSISGL